MGPVGTGLHARGQDSAPVAQPLGFAGRDPISALPATVANPRGAIAKEAPPRPIRTVSFSFHFFLFSLIHMTDGGTQPLHLLLLLGPA